MTAKKLTVLIVDDHAIVREGLKSIISKSTDMEVVGDVGMAPDAMNVLRKRGCDLVLLDISLPGKTGLELLKMMRDEFPKVRVLVLSTYPEDQYAIRVLKLGAAGYLTKESAPDLLLTAIRKVAAGGKYVSASLAEKLLEEIGTEANRPLHMLLSDREFEIFKLIAVGRSLTEIADGMCVSIKTISTYRARIIEKTGLKTNADMTRYALEHGLIN